MRKTPNIGPNPEKSRAVVTFAMVLLALVGGATVFGESVLAWIAPPPAQRAAAASLPSVPSEPNVPNDAKSQRKAP